MKSEQYNEDVTDICEFIHKYVPGHDESDDWNKKPEKNLSVVVTIWRLRDINRLSSKRNGRTPSKRLEGPIPKMEEFHNQGEVLKVYVNFVIFTSYSYLTSRVCSQKGNRYEVNDMRQNLLEKLGYNYIAND